MICQEPDEEKSSPKEGSSIGKPNINRPTRIQRSHRRSTGPGRGRLEWQPDLVEAASTPETLKHQVIQ